MTYFITGTATLLGNLRIVDIHTSRPATIAADEICVKRTLSDEEARLVYRAVIRGEEMFLN